MKLEVPQIQHSPFVTFQRFSEMTGLSLRQIRHLDDLGQLPTFRLANGHKKSKSKYVNLFEIQKKALLGFDVLDFGETV